MSKSMSECETAMFAAISIIIRIVARKFAHPELHEMLREARDDFQTGRTTSAAAIIEILIQIVNGEVAAGGQND